MMNVNESVDSDLFLFERETSDNVVLQDDPLSHQIDPYLEPIYSLDNNVLLKEELTGPSSHYPTQYIDPDYPYGPLALLDYDGRLFLMYNTTYANATSNYTNLLEILPILNITTMFPIKVAMPLFGYIMPILLVITIIANTLIVVVLAKRHMRTPTNLVLMAMAIADMFTLLVPAPWLFYMYTLGNHPRPLYPLSLCYTYHFMNDVIPNLFHTSSIWLTLALAVQRYIYVCLPTAARSWCTVPRAKLGIFWIFVTAMLHQSTRFFDFYYSISVTVWKDHYVPSCSDQQVAEWVQFIGVNLYYNLYFWFRIICVHLSPCVLLIILNVMLFRAMRDAQKKRERLFKEKKKSSECKKLGDSNCTTLMLIVVVTVFLVVEIPLAIITLLHVLANMRYIYVDYDVIRPIILVSNFFIALTYPVNFAIYCGMSRQFRETFKELFMGSVVSAGRLREGSSRYSVVNNGPRTCTNETAL